MNQSQFPFADLYKETKTFKTRDNLSIRYILNKTKAENTRGTVVLVSGWTEFIEKYGEPMSKILERGFNVYTMDWRGQGLSSRALPNREKGYVRSFSEFVDDLHELVVRIVQPEAAKPCILMGHSMGGNVAIQYLHDHPGFFTKAIFCCPLIDLPVTNRLKAVFGALISTARVLGFGKKYVPGRGNWTEIPFEENQVTSDPERYAHDLALLQQNPKLRIGGPTYIWLNAALKAIKRVSQISFLKEIQIPTMLLSASADLVVSISAHEFAARHLPHCDLVLISDGMHELLRETDAIQEKVWEQFDRFLSDIQPPDKNSP